MRRTLPIAVLVAGLSSPALATEWVNCAAPDGAASFDYLAGTLDVLTVVGMTITAGEQVWATDPAYGPGDPVIVGQAFETGDAVLVDAVTPDLTQTIASLRLFKATEGDFVAYGGVLTIPGKGAWAVSCSGP